MAEADGLRIVADTLALDSQWVPLATTRRFLAGNRELVGKVAAIYRDSVQLFKNDARLARATIGRQLPALRSKPEVLDKCYRVFAELFEPTLIVAPAALTAVLCRSRIAGCTSLPPGAGESDCGAWLVTDDSGVAAPRGMT